MTKRVIGIVVVLASIAFVAVCAFAYRNIRFDEGAAALKIMDYPRAFERLKPLAALGDSHAQFILGQLYAYGLGTPKDDDQAIEWFRRAGWEYHGQGNSASVAEYYVALEYAEDGGIVQKNEAEALKWLRKAAEGGNADAAKMIRSMEK